MNIAFIVPTGIGAEIGGHAGDANAVARLFASICDNLITHPNVVNACDINEMTENTLYVEGSILDLFLEGKVGLKRVKKNKILVASNAPVPNFMVNSVSAARATLGIDAEIVELETPLRLVASMAGGIASGEVFGWRELLNQVSGYKFDVLAIASPIEVSDEIKVGYLDGDIKTNPWGGVEAKASRLIAEGLRKPVAHAPIILEDDILNGYEKIVDPRHSAETVSISYIHCVLKGLNKAPRLDDYATDLDINNGGVDYLVTPHGCFGRPHEACLKKGIPIIAVKENKTVLDEKIPDEVITVHNYLEAIGVIKAMEEGISLDAVTRPIEKTIVHRI